MMQVRFKFGPGGEACITLQAIEPRDKRLLELFDQSGATARITKNGDGGLELWADAVKGKAKE